MSARQLRILDDLEQRHLAGATEDGKDGAVGKMVDGVVAPFIGGDHAPVKPQDLVQFTPVEPHRLVEAFTSCLMQRDQYCGCVPILRPTAVISHASIPSNLTLIKVGAFAMELQAQLGKGGRRTVSAVSSHVYKTTVGIGDASPQFCLLLSALMPQSPTNLRVLPETVRSGTGS
ncbi:hypothetical protein BQ8794_40335 [Mesorhizobium prunaredense]|uniref:Uncharacterized protein n=1 Tax=Mesorhizobium prunaredense TaxID=1631249 RepID=A0A1R3VCY5_9HYPH|nr:hypothetical protein BQ8794_40335 [Mesorhizobium prunaredense]